MPSRQHREAAEKSKGVQGSRGERDSQTPLCPSSKAATGAQDLSDAASRRAKWEHLAQTPREEREAPPTPVLLHLALDELAACLRVLHVPEETLRMQNRSLEERDLARRAERRRYLDLFASAPDALLVTNTGGLILQANPAAARLLGLGARYLVGSAPPRFLTEGGRVTLLGVLLTAAGGAAWEGGLELQPRKGMPVEAVVIVIPILPGDGRPSALRWLIRPSCAGSSCAE
jgi:PAS domain S-box-containing protein